LFSIFLKFIELQIYKKVDDLKLILIISLYDKYIFCFFYHILLIYLKLSLDFRLWNKNIIIDIRHNLKIDYK